MQTATRSRPFLALDTASPTVTVAIGTSGDLRHTSLPIAKSSVELLGAIDSLLEQHGSLVQDLAGVLCTAGPGSFTGIRVGMATVMGLGESLDIPTVALPSLWVQAHWMCQLTSDPQSRIASILRAHRDQCFVQIFQTGSTPRSESPINITTDFLEQLDDREMVVVSSDSLVRQQASAYQTTVLDPGPLATHLVMLATANPPAQTSRAVDARTLKPANAQTFDWDVLSLSRPLYAQTPAVANRPRTRSGAPASSAPKSE